VFRLPRSLSVKQISAAKPKLGVRPTRAMLLVSYAPRIEGYPETVTPPSVQATIARLCALVDKQDNEPVLLPPGTHKVAYGFPAKAHSGLGKAGGFLFKQVTV
jgi:hypothetical protein